MPIEVAGKGSRSTQLIDRLSHNILVCTYWIRLCVAVPLAQTRQIAARLDHDLADQIRSNLRSQFVKLLFHRPRSAPSKQLHHSLEDCYLPFYPLHKYRMITATPLRNTLDTHHPHPPDSLIGWLLHFI
jgi:hypothetical protein